MAALAPRPSARRTPISRRRASTIYAKRAEHADNGEGQAEQTNRPGDRLGEPRILRGQTDVGQRRHRDARPRIECPRTARVGAEAPGVVARTSRFDVVTKYRRCGSGGT